MNGHAALEPALDVANGVSHYGLWVAGALILIIAVRVRRRRR